MKPINIDFGPTYLVSSYGVVEFQLIHRSENPSFYLYDTSLKRRHDRVSQHFRRKLLLAKRRRMSPRLQRNFLANRGCEAVTPAQPGIRAGDIRDCVWMHQFDKGPGVVYPQIVSNQLVCVLRTGEKLILHVSVTTNY